MSRARPHLSLVVDQVVSEASAAARRREGEARAVKEAAAQPKTDLARGFRALAAELRSHSDDVTYADLAGAL